MPEGPLGFPRITDRGPFVTGECDEVESLDTPIETMALWESEPTPLFTSTNYEELNAHVRGGKRSIGPGEMLALHSIEDEGSGQSIIDSGFDEPSGSGFGSNIRKSSIFFWIHSSDIGTLGGYPYVISVIDIDESFVSDFDMFYEIEAGDITGEEYDERVVSLRKYLKCVSEGKDSGEPHTKETLLPYRL